MVLTSFMINCVGGQKLKHKGQECQERKDEYVKSLASRFWVELG